MANTHVEPVGVPPNGIVCVPMNVDAFILNEDVCNSGPIRVAPVTQPDYHGLRPNPAEIRNDILAHVDVQDTQPAWINSRISAVETPNTVHIDPNVPASRVPLKPPLRRNRVGAHVHWSLPRMYRASTESADSTKKNDTIVNMSAEPLFRPVPNRWVVVRNLKSYEPANAPGVLPQDAWVIESDRLWTIDGLSPNVDLETDVSPYVNHVQGDEDSKDTLNNLAQCYIGEKISAKDWRERGDTVPRVPLTTMNSSNLYFADNTHHNTNVFSMIDDFHYTDPQGKVQYLTKATCDYAIVGWHSNLADDPLFSGPLAVKGSLKDRLRALYCILEHGEDKLARQSLLPFFTRVLCHGTIFNVQFDLNNKPPTPAAKFADLFTGATNIEPISIGTTPLDSILTFLKAHEGQEDTIFGGGSRSIVENIRAMNELLYSSEDGYDSRVKASDLIFAHNFARSAGGNAWHFNGKAQQGGSPALPKSTPDAAGKSDIDYLKQVNDLQTLLDALNRKLKLTKWSLFAVWWKYVSDPMNADATRMTVYQESVKKLRSLILSLQNQVSDPNTGLNKQITDLTQARRVGGPFGLWRFPPVQTRKIANPTFHTRKDPTLCIAGMDSGWDTRYMEMVLVRLSTYLPQSEVTAPLQGIDPVLGNGMTRLLIEAINNQDIEQLTKGLGFKVWTGQPWQPLFAEWEATYFHVPFEKWNVQLANSPTGNNHDQVRYTISEPLYKNSHSTDDQRNLSGRLMVLPQPTLNLQAIVAQCLDIAGVKLPPGVTDAQAFIQSIAQLKFISSDLDGVTTGLLTQSSGSHVQPNLSIGGDSLPLPLAAAIQASTDIGLTKEDFQLIGDESALTPYGTLLQPGSPFSPFKPATHGQLHFNKLNIVDKFGQVISAIDPSSSHHRPGTSFSTSDTIYPCLGDQVCPSLIKGDDGRNLLNTVAPLTASDPHLPNNYPLCPYIQLTPAINQDARLNAHFVMPTRTVEGKFNGWRPTFEWEQPIWGWVVVNFANYGLQFFTGEGTFYVEMTFGGPTNTTASAKWLPFDPPTQADVIVSPQLDQLIKQFTTPNTGPAYLQSFYDMITSAIVNMPFAPPEYAAFASAIVGKPLALTNVGLSLELATQPLESQVTLPMPAPITPGQEEILKYKFPIKIGDADRPFDGVVGYFDTDNTTAGSTTWTKLHTYFTSSSATPPTAPQTGDPRVIIAPSDFPTLSPYYIHPDGPLKLSSYLAESATKLVVKTMLLDPYTPIHVYSPILPITELKLSAWNVQTALQRMTAFFTLGPCLLTRDVPKVYDATNPLAPTTWLEDQKKLAAGAEPETAKIRLPIAGKKGLWNWLQPYVVDGPEGGEEKRRYNGMAVGEEDGRIRMDPAPYTLVEGFLQLARPLGTDDVRM